MVRYSVGGLRTVRTIFDQLSGDQLVGLADVLPAGYPKTSGVVILTDDRRGGTRRSRRRKPTKKTMRVPWYQLFGTFE